MENTVFFNLFHAGDSAVVRLLHTTINTIEAVDTHFTIGPNNAKKTIKCIGDGCPLCASSVGKNHKIYVHLFDYTDNTEKVWVRTDKIIPQFESIEKDWGDLSKLVLRITRDYDDFPTYTVTQVPSTNYQNFSGQVDEKVSFRFYTTRNAEAINTFMQTGIMPEKKKKEGWLPKEEYIAKMKESGQVSSPASAQTESKVNNESVVTNYQVVKDEEPVKQYVESLSKELEDPFLDPFSDPFDLPFKV